MKKINILLAMLSVAAITFTSCKDDKDDSNNSGPAQPGTVTLDLTNVAGTVNVDETGATSYTNSSGESFTVTKLKYYISNVRLLNADSVVYSLPDGYFLVDESNQPSTKLSFPNVPGGAYTSIKFTLGVDSARNVSGAQTGALDPANGMFWTWSSGYIFYKLEGTSTAAPVESLTISGDSEMQIIPMPFVKWKWILWAVHCRWMEVVKQKFMCSLMY